MDPKQVMEERKWEDLDMDCLVNVLGRVGIESLLLDVPFVCKLWHTASLDPVCWRNLVFPSDSWFYDFSYLTKKFNPWYYDSFMQRFIEEYQIKKISATSFIKFIVDRSCKNAGAVILPGNCTLEALKYVANECLDLRTLGIPFDICYYNEPLIIQQLLPKLKNLKGLCLGCSINLKKILVQISLNCKNFVDLHVINARIGQDEALAIVTLLPEIKYLLLFWVRMDRESLETILQGCKELVLLDVRNCIGFEADEKILELASHIETFTHVGSRLYDDGEIDHANIGFNGYYSN